MEKEKPLVSVIMPSFNHGAFIGEAINSVLCQTYTNFELLIYDDASSDNSVEVINCFDDPRIRRKVHPTNIGATPNTNKLIQDSRGELIALMTSDDYWIPDKLEKQVLFITENPQYGAVFTNTRLVSETGHVLTVNENQWANQFDQPNRTQAKWLRHFFFKFNCLCHPSILIRKSVYDCTSLFNIGLRQLPDFKMWVDIVKFTPIYILPEVMTNLRILKNSANTSADTAENANRTRNEIHLILQTFFEGVSSDMFVEGFSDLFHNQNASDEIDYRIEQAFLYLNIQTELRNLYASIGVEKLYALLQEPKIVKRLETNYQFTFRNFYELTGKVFRSPNDLCPYPQDLSNMDKLFLTMRKVKKKFFN